MQKQPEEFSASQKDSGQQQNVQDQESEQDFLIIDGLCPEELQKMNEEHRRDVEKFYETNRKYEIDHWYEALKEFTFESKDLQLTSIDAYILHWIYYNGEEKFKQSETQQEKKLIELKGFYDSLKQKVSAFLKENKFLTSGCFIKLSTRSPKDYGHKLTQKQIDEKALQLFHRLKAMNFQKQNPVAMDNEIFRYFLDLSKDRFKVKSSSDFIDIFSRSQRIIVDLGDYSLLKGEIFSEFQEGNFSRAQSPFIKVWARKWEDFGWHQEVRCFYNDFKMTSATQYVTQCYFSELEGNERVITKLITEFFEEIRPKLKQIELQKGVMDLVIDLEAKRVKMIEINVFNPNTRSGLFDWEHDLNQLENGDFDLRLKHRESQKRITKYEMAKMMGMIEQQEVITVIDKALSQNLQIDPRHYWAADDQTAQL